MSSIVTLIIRNLPLSTGSMANASDAEKGEASPRVPKQSKIKAKKSCPLKKILVGIFLLICLFVAMFGMGVLGAHFAAHNDSSNEVLDGASHEPVLAIQVASAHDERFIARRDQTADASYPISTKTALSTIYEVRHTPTLEIETVFETVTGTTYVTVPDEVPVSVSTTTFEETTEYCEDHVVTMTKTVTFVVTPDKIPAATSAALPGTPVVVTEEPQTVTETEIDTSITSGLPDAIITGNPETVTEADVDTSVTSGLPDAVVTGNPETVTKSEIDTSATSNLPDVTVTGNPETVTATKVDTSVTSGLPDAVVTGNPETVTRSETDTSVTDSVFTTITVSNLTPTIVPPELPPKSTVTSCTTFVLTLPYSKPTNIVGVPPESTVTATIYETEGDASTSTTTVFVPPSPYPPQPPYPTANDTTLPDSTSNNPIVPHMPTPTPVIISGGTKKPEPRGWGGTSGTTNLSCTVMLVAVIMFLL
ncbi:hypothetical protein FAUST_3181 [Fusarium austroamericanum]|uniref:Uncharacterized protein n=1 Tax=Fusarium austroamericanum TaxID=282268 RepID=A0AAN6C5S4_FUSAU|nr:hypothetical protein FAUST_3181 [Fusarium austroamericanum]